MLEIVPKALKDIRRKVYQETYLRPRTEKTTETKVSKQRFIQMSLSLIIMNAQKNFARILCEFAKKKDFVNAQISRRPCIANF